MSRGRLASASGWRRPKAFTGDIARAAGGSSGPDRLLDEANLDCVERGFLEHAAGMCRIFADGDIAAARAAFGRATKSATGSATASCSRSPGSVRAGA